MNMTETKKGVILEVVVKPRSKGFRIVVEEDEIVVFCEGEPVKGKVNSELIKGFSRLFRKEVELVSGHASKQKKLLIRNARRSDLEHILLHS